MKIIVKNKCEYIEIIWRIRLLLMLCVNESDLLQEAGGS